MTVNRGAAASWALGLGILLASVGGSAVSARTAAEELRYVAAFASLFVPVLYVVIVRQWDHWSGKHPFVRFAVPFLGGFGTIAICSLVARYLFAGFGLATAIIEVLAVVSGFAIAAWFAFYGGDERLWATVVDRLDIDW